MPNLTPRDRRTIRIAAIAITIYLVLFGGFRVWRSLEAKRSEYQKLVAQANQLAAEVQPYRGRVEVVETLMETFQLDPMKLNRSSIVADASAAIQKSATGSGIQIGPIRETPSRASSKELASMQIEGTGPVTAVMGFLHNITTLGYPLVVDSVQINGDNKPGSVKVSLVIIILDFEQWKVEVPNA